MTSDWLQVLVQNISGVEEHDQLPHVARRDGVA